MTVPVPKVVAGLAFINIVTDNVVDANIVFVEVNVVVPIRWPRRNRPLHLVQGRIKLTLVQSFVCCHS